MQPTSTGLNGGDIMNITAGFLIIAILMVVVSIITRKGSKGAMAQKEQWLQNSQTSFEAMHTVVIDRARFIQETNPIMVPQEYYMLQEEAIGLRDLIRKERGMFSLWKEGDPHPFNSLSRWKAVRDRRVEEYQQRGILGDNSIAIDGTIRDWCDHRRFENVE